jgi:branched-chain amino acid transport system permease protein
MQVLVNGFVSGASIALLALGFAVVYLPTRVFHIALAGIYSLVPFLALTLGSVGIPWPICAIVAILGGGVLSVLCEGFNHARLDRKGAGPGLHLVSSLGIFIVIVQLIAMIWGNEVNARLRVIGVTYRSGLFLGVVADQPYRGGRPAAAVQFNTKSSPLMAMCDNLAIVAA